MHQTTQNFSRPGHEVRPEPNYPHAPVEWSPAIAEETALAQGLTLTEDHWRVVRALQELYWRGEEPAMNARGMHNALDEAFLAEGGIRYLYLLFPKGPLAQGCLLAGLQPPMGTQDQGFGSAV